MPRLEEEMRQKAVLAALAYSTQPFMHWTMASFTYWVLAVVAIGYSLLAAWRYSVEPGNRRAHFLAFAFLSMAIAAAAALIDRLELIAFRELLRNFAWLAYIHVATRLATSGRQHRWLLRFEIGLALLLLLSAFATIAPLLGPGGLVTGPTMIVLAVAFRLGFSLLAIIFAHNLYRATPADNSGFRLILIAVGILWACDVNLYTLTLLGYDHTPLLLVGRAMLSLLLLPVFALAARRRESWQISLSRKATFQSLTVVSLGGYFVLMSVIARTAALLDSDFGTMAAFCAGLGVTATGAYLLVSARARAWLKVMVTKHLFQHRYDYRSEWLRFSSTIAGEPGETMALEERVVKATADIMEATGGLLFLADNPNSHYLAGRWNWAGPLPADEELHLPDDLVFQLQSGRVLTAAELDAERSEGLQQAQTWLQNGAWVAMPLIHAQALIGLVILSRPIVPRELDWEDFDLLKLIGHQAAVHIVVSHNQTRLEEASRFDEFNRRFAFIIHDVKNVVSQLSLLASNAREHGANPQFQADMAESLSNAVHKMNGLLSRLATDRSVPSSPAHSIPVHELLRDVAKERARQHPVMLDTVEDIWVVANKEKLATSLEHLIQNAIEASDATSPIYLSSRAQDGKGLIGVADRGHGMSAEFIRKHLFKPFVSTKAGGFGIGAAESRALVNSMGGILTVNSAEGEGSLFTISLPLSQEGGEEQA
jgi:putative PEP-CTERM system histidine kinase